MAHFARLSIYIGVTVFLVLNFVCGGFASAVIGYSQDCKEITTQYCQNKNSSTENAESNVQQCLDDVKKICQAQNPDSKKQQKRCRRKKEKKCNKNVDTIQKRSSQIQGQEFYQCCERMMGACLQSAEDFNRDGQNAVQSNVTVPVEFCYSEGDCHLVYVTYQTYTIV